MSTAFCPTISYRNLGCRIFSIFPGNEFRELTSHRPVRQTSVGHLVHGGSDLIGKPPHRSQHSFSCPSSSGIERPGGQGVPRYIAGKPGMCRSEVPRRGVPIADETNG
ncbi:MAG: hypothetical protein D6741_15515 [Planctomycetota bacterium]|nr:MAG: hypothetical protein D6741_15515 [Planctomycetota bacterium]